MGLARGVDFHGADAWIVAQALQRIPATGIGAVGCQRKDERARTDGAQVLELNGRGVREIGYELTAWFAVGRAGERNHDLLLTALAWRGRRSGRMMDATGNEDRREHRYELTAK